MVLISIKAHAIGMLDGDWLVRPLSQMCLPGTSRKKGKRPFPRLLCSYDLRVGVGSNYQMQAAKPCTWNLGERKLGGGVVKVAAQGAFLSGTDPGSCCVALQFPDPQIKTMMM